MATMWSLTVLRRVNVKAVARLSTTILSILVVAILLGLPAVALVLANVTATARIRPRRDASRKCGKLSHAHG